MYSINAECERGAEYYTLYESRPCGPLIGTYRGQPIPSEIMDEYGRRYAYAGLAPRQTNGMVATESLGHNEWLIKPGLVYRRIG